MSLFRRPFRSLGAQQYLNLALFALALCYAVFAVLSVHYSGPLMRVGGDYRAFRSAAEVAWRHGFAEMYNQGRIDAVQRLWYERYRTSDMLYAPVPVASLPLFILPFLPLLLLDPVSGFLVWTVLNAMVMLLYLWRLTRALGGQETRGVLLLLLLSFPFFLNLFFGQVNLLMLVALGESYLVWRRGNEFGAGLWLGGLLIKPQALVLLLPGLLLARRFKSLAGFALAGLAVGGSSLLLLGVRGLGQLIQVILDLAPGLPIIAPKAMMNWRALAINIETVVPSVLAWGVVAAGMIVTTGVALSLWFRPAAPASPRFALALLGTYAATGAVTWHAHIHMALPLIVPFLALLAERRLPRAILNTWALLPAGVFLVTSLIAPHLADGLAGTSMLVLNLYLLAWAAQMFWQSHHRKASSYRTEQPQFAHRGQPGDIIFPGDQP